VYRIEKLRKIALDSAAPSKDAFNYKFYKTFSENINKDKFERYAISYYTAFTSVAPNISDDELIVGKFSNSMTDAEIKEWQDKYKEFQRSYLYDVGKTIHGPSSHMSIDYELVLSKGLNGVIDRIESYMENCESDKIPFYKTCKICLDAVIKHSENYALEAKRLAKETKDKNRRQELERIAEICMNVPANPARNFYEAVQAVHFITYCITFNPFYGIQLFQTGRPDQYLLPFYLKDSKEGKITKEFAQLLLDCWGIQMNMIVQKGFSVGYMVGGRRENGELVSNELTDMCMQVIDDIRLVYPAVGFCYTEDLPEQYLEKACSILMKGRSHPAIFNDDIIIKGLIKYGLPETLARNYIHSTCVEVTPIAASNVWVAAPYVNMAQILLDVLDENYESFEMLLDSLFEHIDKIIEENFLFYEKLKKNRFENSMFPLLSCFVNDCLKRGLDIEQGGAIYNWTQPSFIGMANLVDSLCVLKEIVFDKKEISIIDFKKILDSDFESNEAFRLRVLNTIAKYGNDIDEVDNYFKLITEHIVSECKKHKGFLPNSDNIPSMFCFKNHVRHGNTTGATPDGRKKGFPLGDGSGPAQGRELKGPTASILSSTKWEHYEFIGGIAVNIKFSKASLGQNSMGIMKSLIKTYFKRGGFEIQINVTDKETLLKAVDNPEEYRDLIVRIGGYSDYFVNCLPEMQQEIILRTEHEI